MTLKNENNTQTQSAHDDFDWSIDKRNVISYTVAEKQKYDTMYDNSFVSITDGKIFTGHIMSVSKTDVVVSIGYKSDGLVSLNEFKDMAVKVGDEVEVLVVEKEDKQGQLILSRKRAQIEKAWLRILELNQTGEIVIGRITSKTKGGLIVELFGIDTFLPGSQIDVKPVTDYDQFVGKTMEFKVVKINETIRNAVVSHKILIEKDMESQRAEMMGKLEKGQIVEGTVKNITDFGAFLDLGGLDGLLYITDISWGRISHPSELLKIDQKLNVVVLDFNDNKKRISLGLKQLSPHPWDSLDTSIGEGSKVKAKVVNVEDYGGFLEIIPGVEGLVHVSEITWSNTIINSRDFFKLGDLHEVMIAKLNREERKISLSIKRLVPDPWDNIDEKYAVHTRHKGTVKNMTQYGVFIDLEPGIGGMIHVSDLSWLKRFNHPSQYVQVGAEIEAIVTNIDKDNRKIQLGHKQIEEDPWVSLESVFTIGSIHEGTLIKKDDKGGAIIGMPYGLEAYATDRQLQTAEGKALTVDASVEFVITDFDVNERKFYVSHTRVWEQDKRSQKEQEVREHKQDAIDTTKKIKSIQSKIEKSTIGDLSALTDLKKKMQEKENK